MIYTLENVSKKNVEGKFLDEKFDITFLALTTHDRDFISLCIIETERKTGDSYLIDKLVINKTDVGYLYRYRLSKAQVQCTIGEQSLRYHRVDSNFKPENQRAIRSRGYICLAEVVDYRIGVPTSNPLRVYHNTHFECFGFCYLLEMSCKNAIYTDDLPKQKDDELAQLINGLASDNMIYLDKIVSLVDKKRRYVNYEIE